MYTNFESLREEARAHILETLENYIGEEELCSMFEGCEEWDEFWNEEIGETETKVLIAWLKDNERV